MLNFTNRNEIFYNYLFDGLQGLKKYEPNLTFSMNYNDQKVPLCQIILTNDKKDDVLSANLSMVMTKGKCTFMIYLLRRLQFDQNNEINTRKELNSWIDLLESQLKSIKTDPFTIKNPITNADFYRTNVYEFSITEINKIYPSNEYNFMDIMINGEIIYSQTYLY
jgi:hypothetical protein